MAVVARTGDTVVETGVLPTRVRVGWALLVLAPLAVWPWAAEPYPVPKALVAAIGAALVLSGPRRTATPRPISWLLVATCAWLVVAALVSVGPVSAILGRYPRYEGVWVIGTYLAALAAGARGRAWWPQLAAMTTALLSGGAALVLLVAVVQGFGSGTERTGSLLGNATDLGVWAAMAALWLIPAAAAGRRRITVPGAVCALGAVALSGSRSALLGLAVGLLLLVALRWPDRSLRWSAVAAIAVLPLLLLVSPGSASRVIGSDPVAVETMHGRLVLWEDSVRLVLAHPIVGVGPSQFVDQVATAHTARWAADVGPTNPPDTPHSLLLQAGSAGGVVLVVLLIAVAALVARRAWVAARADAALAGIATSLVAVGVALLLNFTTPSTTVFACLGAGLLVGDEVRQRAVGALRMAQVVGTALAAAALAAVLASEVAVASALDGLATGQPGDSAWQLAATLHPGDVDLALRRGHALTAAAGVQALPAAACLDATATAADRLPQSSEAALDRARCLELNGGFADGATVLASALEHDPVNVDLLLLRGVLSAEAGDTTTAITVLRRASELRPSASEPWTDLATVYRMRGETALAQQAADRAAAQS